MDYCNRYYRASLSAKITTAKDYQAFLTTKDRKDTCVQLKSKAQKVVWIARIEQWEPPCLFAPLMKEAGYKIRREEEGGKNSKDTGKKMGVEPREEKLEIENWAANSHLTADTFPWEGGRKVVFQLTIFSRRSAVHLEGLCEMNEANYLLPLDSLRRRCETRKI